MMNKQDLGNVQARDRNLGIVSIQIKVETVRLCKATREVSEERKRRGLTSNLGTV